jgi:3-methyladenine DNA glycosylase Tag
MPMSWKAEKPETDDGYFEHMTRAIMQAGLNWTMIEKKWPNFKKAFANFSIPKVAGYSESNVKTLMKDAGIVRNEKKIRSVIANAGELRRVSKEFGSFRGYLDSFKGDEEELIADLQRRFRHLGESSSRVFLYMAGEKLKPTREEQAWHDSHMKD